MTCSLTCNLRATENPSESGGSFDASGAFHGGMYSDGDDDEGNGVVVGGGHQEHRTRRVSEGNASNNTSRSSNKSLPFNNTPNQGQPANRHTNTSSISSNRERPKSLHPFEDKDTSVDQERSSITPTKPSSIDLSNKVSSAIITGQSARKVQSTANIVKANDVNATIQGPQRSKSFVEQPQRKLAMKTEPSTHETAMRASTPNTVRLPPEIDNAKIIKERVENSEPKLDDDFDRMKEEADMLVAKLMADEESHREEAANVVSSPAVTSSNNHANSMSGQQEKWFYRDPQGDVQGPFLANEMAEWCKAGYFTAGLMVRRTCDERYATLGDLMQMCGGRVPFAPGPIPIPPLTVSIVLEI